MSAQELFSYESYDMIKTVLKYLLAPLFPILVQADQATVASEEAVQGFQTPFD